MSLSFEIQPCEDDQLTCVICGLAHTDQEFTVKGSGRRTTIGIHSKCVPHAEFRNPEPPKLLSPKITARGFRLRTFTDRHGSPCSIQKSSSAEVMSLWLGVDDPDPKIMAYDAYREGRHDLLAPEGTPERTNGWVKYPIPDNVQLSTRMHLSQDMVRELLPLLIHFVETGELPPSADAERL